MVNVRRKKTLHFGHAFETKWFAVCIFSRRKCSFSADADPFTPETRQLAGHRQNLETPDAPKVPSESLHAVHVFV
jgi:hypothetical protein